MKQLSSRFCDDDFIIETFPGNYVHSTVLKNLFRAQQKIHKLQGSTKTNEEVFLDFRVLNLYGLNSEEICSLCRSSIIRPLDYHHSGNWVQLRDTYARSNCRNDRQKWRLSSFGHLLQKEFQSIARTANTKSNPCNDLDRDAMKFLKEKLAKNEAILHPLKPQKNSSVNLWKRVQPVWNSEKRKLSFQGMIVKEFRWMAANQQLILAAFQEDDWPTRIADPLPQNNSQCPKRRLGDTIKCLNRKQINHCIQFHGDGTGQGILWEPVKKPCSCRT